MLKRSVLDLNFVDGKILSPTLEINVESIEKSGEAFHEIVSNALAEYSNTHKDTVSTIYLYGGPSVNFGDFSYSEFLIVPKNIRVLEFLKKKFESFKDIQSRFGEYMLPSQGLKAFHIEGGIMWEPEDMVNWYSLKPEGDKKLINTEIEDSDSEDEFFTDPDDLLTDSVEFSEEDDLQLLESDLNQTQKSVSPKSTLNARYRAARSDARIGHIKREIERVFGLPVGSVALIDPEGSSLRSDAFIRTLHKRWDN